MRMLRGHSSGLPGTDCRNSFTFEPMPSYADDMRQALASVQLKHLPGEMAVYCNDGVTSIELLVAAVTGRQRWPKWVAIRPPTCPSAQPRGSTTWSTK
ncbi:serine hydrolase [Candidatus Aalborgicola defluviihabitans]|uniref:serine hydrolase n=1 Tax=Candidatus Aalborgicola defluviihabitans TaxID=3386187 RepID=UPI0039B92ECC